MLAHLPNRFNSLTRGHIHATRKSLQRRETVRFRQVCVCTLARLHKPPSRRLARRSRSLCRCYDCRCVYAQLLHALGARVYTSVIALLCLPTLLHVGNPFLRTALLSRRTSGSQRAQRLRRRRRNELRRCRNSVEYRVHGIEIENYTVCRHERVARLSARYSLRKNVCFLESRNRFTDLCSFNSCHEFKLSCSIFVKLRVRQTRNK